MILQELTLIRQILSARKELDRQQIEICKNLFGIQFFFHSSSAIDREILRLELLEIVEQTLTTIEECNHYGGRSNYHAPVFHNLMDKMIRNKTNVYSIEYFINTLNWWFDNRLSACVEIEDDGTTQKQLAIVCCIGSYWYFRLNIVNETFIEPIGIKSYERIINYSKGLKEFEGKIYYSRFIDSK